MGRRPMPLPLVVVVAVALAAAAPAARADTTVDSSIGADTTWTTAGSPYHVTKDVSVASAATLTVDPGVRVVFDQDAQLTVGGTLDAEGTAGAPITFDVAPGLGSGARWAGIAVQESGYASYAGTITMARAEVRHATWGLTMAAGSTADHVLLASNQHGAMLVFGGAITASRILDDTIDGAYLLEGGSVTASTIAGNGSGVRIIDQPSTTTEHPAPISIRDNRIQNNGLLLPCQGCVPGGVAILGRITDVDVSDNAIVGNRTGMRTWTDQAPAAGTFTASGNDIFGSSESDWDLSLYQPASAVPQGADLAAPGNWWGTTDDDAIAANVHDHADDATLGALDTTPALTAAAADAPAPDLTAPQTTVTAAPASVTSSATATFTFASSEPDGAEFRCTLDGGTPAACPANATFSGLVQGNHTLSVVAVDGVRNVDPTPATATWRYDTTPPTAQLTAPAMVSTGAPVVLDATGSSDPNAGTVDYAWDLDGNGSFETDGGTTPTLTTSFATAGTVTVGVRVTDAAGLTDVGTAAVEARPAPPAGEKGVSIDAGAQFTNDPDVALAVVWPEFATEVIVSNDGGFADARHFPIGAASIPWTLDSSGPERLPKTVYVRFAGAPSGTESYQDDIILDETPPAITEAALSRRDDGLQLTVKASDDGSGVASMQLTDDTATPGAVRSYVSTVAVPDRTKPLFVRVLDGAGNTSPWTSVPTPAAAGPSTVVASGLTPVPIATTPPALLPPHRGFGAATGVHLLSGAKTLSARGGTIALRLTNDNAFAVTGIATLTRRSTAGASRATPALAVRSFTLPASRTTSIKLKLTAAARRLLRRGHHVRASLTIKLRDPAAATRTLSFVRVLHATG